MRRVQWFPALGNPWLYLLSEAALITSFVLAFHHPSSWPTIVLGPAITVSALYGYSMAEHFSDERGGGVPGAILRAQLWLYVGGAIPAALVTITGRRDEPASTEDGAVATFQGGLSSDSLESLSRLHRAAALRTWQARLVLVAFVAVPLALASGSAEVRHDRMLLRTQSPIEAKVTHSGTTGFGRNTEPEVRLSIDGRVVTLLFADDLAYLPNVGDELPVVVDPHDPDHVIPITRASGWEYTTFGTVVLLALFGVIIYGVGWGSGQVPRAGRKAAADAATLVVCDVLAVTKRRQRPIVWLTSGTYGDSDITVDAPGGRVIVPVRTKVTPDTAQPILLTTPAEPGSWVAAVQDGRAMLPVARVSAAEPSA